MKKYLFIAVVLLQACLKEDVKILPPLPHEMETVHSLQFPHVFIDVNRKLIAKKSSDSTWHLKFQNGENDWAIFLNPLRDISVHKTSLTDIEEVLPSYVVQNELDWHRDASVKDNVLPAIGTWGDYSFQFPKSFNNVYILRIKNKQEIVHFKLQILAANNLNYTIQYSDLNGDNASYYVLPKDKNTTHSYLKMRPFPSLVEVEPNKQDWQLQFTFGLDSINANLDQYLMRQYNMLGLYQKLNTNKELVEVAMEKQIPYEEIDYFKIKRKVFLRVEQMKVPFVYYDYAAGTLRLRTGVSLICKLGETYVKVAPERFEQIQPGIFEVKMRMQNL